MKRRLQKSSVVAIISVVLMSNGCFRKPDVPQPGAPKDVVRETSSQEVETQESVTLLIPPEPVLREFPPIEEEHHPLEDISLDTSDLPVIR